MVVRLENLSIWIIYREEGITMAKMDARGLEVERLCFETGQDGPKTLTMRQGTRLHLDYTTLKCQRVIQWKVISREFKRRCVQRQKGDEKWNTIVNRKMIRTGYILLLPAFKFKG